MPSFLHSFSFKVWSKPLLLKLSWELVFQLNSKCFILLTDSEKTSRYSMYNDTELLSLSWLTTGLSSVSHHPLFKPFLSFRCRIRVIPRRSHLQRFGNEAVWPWMRQGFCNTSLQIRMTNSGWMSKYHSATERTGEPNELPGWLLTTLSPLGSALMNPLVEMRR